MSGNNGAEEADYLSAGPWGEGSQLLGQSQPSPRPPLSSRSRNEESGEAAVSRALSFIEPGQRHGEGVPDSQRLRAPGLLDPASRSRSLYLPRQGTQRTPSSSLLDTLPRPKPMRSASTAGPPTVAPADEVDEEGMQAWRAKAHGDTPLDRTIDAIGMGRYQWALLVLTGCGWAADNMWLQGVAIILPRVQANYAISDAYIGLLSSSTFTGMTFGALAWGAYSDTYGRRGAFNGTLTLVAAFGTLAAFAPGFVTLCACLFGLGLGLGGSMPTDGTVFLENLPVRKQYLLTALSVFFSAGSVFSALIAILVLPSTPTSSSETWRYFLGFLAVLTAFFVVLRLVFFPLLESPRFLVSSGRREEAREALRKIAEYNARPLPVELGDVSDRRASTVGKGRTGGREGPDGGGQRGSMLRHEVEVDEAEQDSEDDDGGYAHGDPSSGGLQRSGGYRPLPSTSGTAQGASDTPREASSPSASDSTWRDTLATLREKYHTLLYDPYWRRTTLLVWAIWITVNLGFTMFNVFLPKLLAERVAPSTPSSSASASASVRAKTAGDSEHNALLSYLLYSLLSLPGPLLSSYLVQLPPPIFGRRGTLALSLLATGACIATFFYLSSSSGASGVTATLATMSVSLAASTAYAALYGYTPEVFSPPGLRGTAAGTARALGRLAGIVAPLLAGTLLAGTGSEADGGGGGHGMLGFVCTTLFLLAAGCSAALPIETWTDPRAGDEGAAGEDGEEDPS